MNVYKMTRPLLVIRGEFDILICTGLGYAIMLMWMLQVVLAETRHGSVDSRLNYITTDKDVIFVRILKIECSVMAVN